MNRKYVPAILIPLIASSLVLAVSTTAFAKKPTTGDFTITFLEDGDIIGGFIATGSVGVQGIHLRANTLAGYEPDLEFTIEATGDTYVGEPGDDFELGVSFKGKKPTAWLMYKWDDVTLLVDSQPFGESGGVYTMTDVEAQFFVGKIKGKNATPTDTATITIVFSLKPVLSSASL